MQSIWIKIGLFSTAGYGIEYFRTLKAGEGMKQTDRLDRIEKGLDLLLKGIDALRKSQKQTDEQLRQTDEQILELRNAQKQTDEQLRQTDELLKQTIKQMNETDGRLEKKLNKIGENLGNIGITQGEIAEDLFYRNVKHVFSNRGKRFSSVIRNLKKKGGPEFDIVAENSGEVLVISVKNKLSNFLVEEFVNEKLPVFKTAFPKYKNCKVIGGMGALVVKEAVGRYAQKAGLYVLTQTTDGGAALLNTKRFRPKIFE